MAEIATPSPRLSRILAKLGIKLENYYALSHQVVEGPFVFEGGSLDVSTAFDVPVDLDSPAKLRTDYIGSGGFYLFLDKLQAWAEYIAAPAGAGDIPDLVAFGFIDVEVVNAQPNVRVGFAEGCRIWCDIRPDAASAGTGLLPVLSRDLGIAKPKGGLIVNSDAVVSINAIEAPSAGTVDPWGSLWADGIAVSKALIPQDPTVPYLTECMDAVRGVSVRETPRMR